MKKMLLTAVSTMFALALCGCAPSAADMASNLAATSAGSAQQSTSASAGSIQQPAATTSSSTTSEEAYADIDYDLSEYTKDGTLNGGYSYEATLKIGSWIKASETEKVNAAWRAVGGQGSLPDINSFRPNGYATYDHFYEIGTSLYVFGTMSVTDTTTGGFSIADSSQTLSLTVACPDIKNSYKAFDGLVEYSGGNIKYTHSVESYVSNMVHMTPNMESKNWGPVPFAVCVAEALSPEHPNGDPDIIDAVWDFGGKGFHVYPMWVDSSEFSADGLMADFSGVWEGDSGSVIEFFEDGTATLVKLKGNSVNEDGTWEKDSGNALFVDFPSVLQDGGADLSDGYKSTSFTMVYEADNDDDYFMTDFSDDSDEDYDDDLDDDDYDDDYDDAEDEALISERFTKKQ